MKQLTHLNLSLFTSECERETGLSGEGTERETQNLKQASDSELSEQTPNTGLEITNPEIMT